MPMPSIPLIKTEKLIRILLKNGFSVDRSKGKGSHVKLYGKDGKTMTIPKSLHAHLYEVQLENFLRNRV
jgi:predicted RNA binding protein YcfA (HicA-like mRNA interferase family)